MSDENHDYEIGYAKPPAHTRFPKGQSGNPKGRPKGTRNVATIFREMTHELIHVKENGRDRTMTKFEAAVLQLTNKAVSGDLKAVRDIVQWNRVFEEASEHANVEAPDREKDAAVLQSLQRRFAKAAVGPDQRNAA